MSKPFELDSMRACFPARQVKHPIRSDRVRLRKLFDQIEAGETCCAVARREGLHPDLLAKALAGAGIGKRKPGTARQRIREAMEGRG